MRFLIILAIALSLTILWQTSMIAVGERADARISSMYWQAGALDFELAGRE